MAEVVVIALLAYAATEILFNIIEVLRKLIGRKRNRH